MLNFVFFGHRKMYIDEKKEKGIGLIRIIILPAFGVSKEDRHLQP